MGELAVPRSLFAAPARFVALALLVAACGGKSVVDENGGSSESAGAGTSSAGSSTASGGDDGGLGDDAVASDVATADAGVAPGAFALTSTAFAEMGTISGVYQCGTGGVSPPLSWTPGPAGTQSYAVVMTDTAGVYYWVIWDIPATTTSLPEGVAQAAMPPVPAGSEQITPAISGDTTPGYSGPCGSGPPEPYTFTVYALDVATLSTVTPASTGMDVANVIQAHTLASAALVGLASHYRS